MWCKKKVSAVEDDGRWIDRIERAFKNTNTSGKRWPFLMTMQ